MSTEWIGHTGVGGVESVIETAGPEMCIIPNGWPDSSVLWIRSHLAVWLQRVEASVIALDEHEAARQVGAPKAALHRMIDFPSLKFMGNHANRMFWTRRNPRVWVGHWTSFPGTLALIHSTGDALQDRATSVLHLVAVCRGDFFGPECRHPRAMRSVSCLSRCFAEIVSIGYEIGLYEIAMEGSAARTLCGVPLCQSVE